MEIYCCKCRQNIPARKTTGEEIYPLREDLYERVFWKCDRCGNYVGSHQDNGHPLGSIPYPVLRDWRILIHNRLDSMWKSGHWSRNQLYKYLSKELGWDFHVSNIRTVTEAEKIYDFLGRLPNSLEEAQAVHNLFRSPPT